MEPRLIRVGPTLTRFPGRPKLPAPTGAHRYENASMTTWARAAIAAAAISCCGVMTAAPAAADRPDYDLSHTRRPPSPPVSA
jgi:hypothetical protein